MDMAETVRVRELPRYTRGIYQRYRSYRKWSCVSAYVASGSSADTNARAAAAAAWPGGHMSRHRKTKAAATAQRVRVARGDTRYVVRRRPVGRGRNEWRTVRARRGANDDAVVSDTVRRTRAPSRAVSPKTTVTSQRRAHTLLTDAGPECAEQNRVADRTNESDPIRCSLANVRVRRFRAEREVSEQDYPPPTVSVCVFGVVAADLRDR